MSGAVADNCPARGFQHLPSPAYTPAARGVVERRNGILKSIFFRMYKSRREKIVRGSFGVGAVLVEACAAKDAVAR